MKPRVLAAAGGMIAAVLAWFLLAPAPPDGQTARRVAEDQSPSANRLNPSGAGTTRDSEPSALFPSAPSSPPPQSSATRIVPTGKFRVRCVDTTCLVGTQVCCDSRDGARCVSPEQACPPFATRYECDETADCAAGQRCCKAARLAACAEGSCAEGQRQLCSDDSECATGSCWMGTTCAKPSAGRLQMPDLPKPAPR